MKKLAPLLVILILIALFASPVKATADIQSGDLIKTANNPAIYYYGSDNKRHLFSNEVTFWTWYSGGWKNQVVKTISQADFDLLNAGNNVTARPGEVFIKFDNSNNIYAVEPGGILCGVKKEFADKQKIKRITVQSGFQADYEESMDCSLSDYTTAENVPEGSIFKYENDSQTFYMSADGVRPIVTADGWNNNRFNINSVLVVKAPTPGSVMPIRANVVAKESIFEIDNEIKEINTHDAESPAIYARSRPCNVANGNNGQQTSNDGINWTNCVTTVCNSGYTLSNGICTQNSTSNSDDAWTAFQNHIILAKGSNLTDFTKTVYNGQETMCGGVSYCIQSFVTEIKYGYSDYGALFTDRSKALIHADSKQAIINFNHDFAVPNFPSKAIITIYMIKKDGIWLVAYNTAKSVAMDLVALGVAHDDGDQDIDGWMDNYEKCEYIGGASIGGICKKTDLNNPDSDSDDWWDGIEMSLGKLPWDASSVPQI